MVEAIVAIDECYGIGKQGGIPWKIREDLLHFKRITLATSREDLRNKVVMGRRTWESLPRTCLPGRLNVVITSRCSSLSVVSSETVLFVPSLAEALREHDSIPIEKTFIIGGSQLYREALPQCHRLYVTRVSGNFACDTFFPPFEEGFTQRQRSVEHTDGETRFRFEVYERTDSSSG